MSTKLKWELFAPRLGTWAPLIKPFFDKGGFDETFEFLKKEGNSGKTIAPASKQLFRCFIETPVEELKVVLMGMCPYHTAYKGMMVADGLLMGAENTKVAPPSLQKFYEGLEHEIYGGLCLTCYWNPSTAYLAKQGVLMFNSALTTEIGTAGAHQHIWEEFTKMIVQKVGEKGVPFIFLGKEASSFRGCLPENYPAFELYHPAYASYKSTITDNVVWETHSAFSKVNDLLKENGKTPVEWLQIRLHAIED